MNETFVSPEQVARWRDDRTVSTETPSAEEAAYDAERTDDDPLITADEMEEALGNGSVIVDTRDPVEYDTVHLPGAVNFRWRDLVDDRGLKHEDECREAFSSAGVDLDTPVRLYCNTARRLSFVYVVLRQLGHDDVAFYEGGIAEWSEYGGAVETT